MLSDFICRVPLWLVKLVVRGVIRKTQMRYNKVKPPNKWEKILLKGETQTDNETVLFDLPNYEMKISSISDGVINIILKEKKEDLVYTNAFIIEEKNKPSLTIEKRGEKLFLQQNNIDAPRIYFNIHLSEGILNIEDADKNLLAKDLTFYHSKDTTWYRLSFRSEGTREHHYGFGEKGGNLDKKGSELEFWNTDSFAYSVTDKRLYQSQPIQIIVRENGYAYCLIYDNPCKSKITISKQKDSSKTTYYVEECGINLYLIAQKSIRDLFRKIVELLGKAAFPPLAVLGNHQSRWSYYPEDEVRAIASEFRRRKIPLDWIHLDIDYMDNYKIFTWNKKHFSEPERLVKDLKKQGVKLVVITDPGIKVEKDYELYEEGISNNHFCLTESGGPYIGSVWPGNCHFPDFTQEKTRKWFGEKFSKFLNIGIKGFWIDMNEPSVFSKKGTMEPTVIHPSDGKNLYHKYIHNLYGFLMSKSVYEGLKALSPNERHFVLTRSAYLGIQRYAGSWTGDNIAEWKHLRISIPMLLNMTVSGQLIVGPDIGGFTGKPSAELLIRWYQAALGYPFYRNHTISKYCSQEPWQYDEKTERYIREAINKRYKLLLYLYLAMKEQCENGLPAFRPLWVEYATDPMAHKKLWAETEYLIGSDILVAPILRKRKNKRKVYLPEGRWYSFDGTKRFEGKSIYTIEAPIDFLPIFVKEGTIIPIIQKDVQHVEEIFQSEIALYVYIDEQNSASGKLYLDDGHSLNHLNGDYELLELRLTKKDEKWLMTVKQSGKSKYIKLGKININGKEADVSVVYA